MKKTIVVAFCMLVMLPLATNAEIYKWKDKTGRVQYSDWPPASNVPYTTLSGKKSSIPPFGPAGSNEETSPPPGGASEPVQQIVPDGSKQMDAAKKALADKELEIQRLQEQQAAQKKAADEAACRNAKSRLAQFEQGGRIYRIDDKGERQYYGDQDISAEISKANADIERFCN